jgi:hypothetical protein
MPKEWLKKKDNLNWKSFFYFRYHNHN